MKNKSFDDMFNDALGDSRHKETPDEEYARIKAALDEMDPETRSNYMLVIQIINACYDMDDNRLYFMNFASKTIAWHTDRELISRGLKPVEGPDGQ